MNTGQSTVQSGPPSRNASRSNGKTWRYSVGRKGTNRVTVYERKDCDSLYIQYTGKDGKRVRKSLTALAGRLIDDKEDAKGIAADVAKSLIPDEPIEFPELLNGAAPTKKKGKKLTTYSADDIGDLDEKELLRNKLTHEPLCGVYILRFRKEIVYIGESSDIHARLNHHRRILPIRWDEVFYLPFENDRKRFVAERALIARFRPLGNGTGHIDGAGDPKRQGTTP